MRLGSLARTVHAALRVAFTFGLGFSGGGVINIPVVNKFIFYALLGDIVRLYF